MKLLIVFCFLFIVSCNSKNETIYILFENNKSDTCNISYYRDGSNKKQVLVKQKKNAFYEKNIVFEICNQSFVFNPDINTKEAINKKPSNISNFDDLINLWEENYLDSRKETVFENIYILEKINDGKYIKYQVLWTDAYVEKD